jgi:hypothetical protein
MADLNEQDSRRWFAHTFDRSGAALYAADLPGCKRDVPCAQMLDSDWGYVTDPGQALPLSDYWSRRFVEDQRAIRRMAHRYPAPNADINGAA